MEGIFTLPYSEYESIIQLQKNFPKKYYSILIPASRQQKGIDFVLMNLKSAKCLRFQVKSSRSWVSSKPDTNIERNFKYTLWFNNFIKRYKSNIADFYILFGLYQIYDNSKNIKSKKAFWKNVILIFKDKEMRSFLKKVKTKKSQESDQFFYVRFSDMTDICATRGFPKPFPLSKYLLQNRDKEIIKILK
ncbi:MAG: hypothetical protein IAE93_05955 [Ignavibacteria bacterium]|nr:hypothetical protein [Ignavibacteria bacterium]